MFISNNLVPKPDEKELGMPRENGVLPMENIVQMISSGKISSDIPVPDGNIQPASIDLRIGEGKAIRLPGIVLPKKGKVFETAQKLSEASNLYSVSLQGDKSIMLEVGVPYLLPVAERISLPKNVCGRANNKSSSGRVNLQVRLLCEGHQEFDMVPRGYDGPLYLLVVAQSFPVHLHSGDALNQLRFYNGSIPECKLNSLDLQLQHEQRGLVFDLEGRKLPWEKVGLSDSSVMLTANLKGVDPVAWRFKGTATHALNYRARKVPAKDFFEPISPPKEGMLVLEKGGFYILSTLEAFSVPGEFCSEMVAYSTGIGEYRSHFAGFFDCGWGNTGGAKGTPAVLEILPHENIIVFHGQPVCLMELYWMLRTPEKLYGSDIGSHYHDQRGPRLGKQFLVK